jgi:hypothetical protein
VNDVSHTPKLRTSVALSTALAMTLSSLAYAQPPLLPPASAASDPLPAAPPPATDGHLALYAAGTLAIVAAGVGTALGVLALDAKNDFEAQPTKSRADTANNDAAYCDAAFGVATLAAATAIVFFLVEKHRPTDPAAQGSPAISFAASPILAPHMAGAGLVFRF